MKLTHAQLLKLFRQTHALTQSGYSLLESLRIVHLLADSSVYLPLSRIIYDLEEGYPLETTIGWNCDSLPDSVRRGLQRMELTKPFPHSLLAFIKLLHQKPAVGALA